MEGGKPRRDCKQSLRPYGESYNFAVWGRLDVPKKRTNIAKQKFPHGVPWGKRVILRC